MVDNLFYENLGMKHYRELVFYSKNTIGQLLRFQVIAPKQEPHE